MAHRLIKYSIKTSYVQLELQKILRLSLGFAKQYGRRRVTSFLRHFVEVSK